MHRAYKGIQREHAEAEKGACIRRQTRAHTKADSGTHKADSGTNH